MRVGIIGAGNGGLALGGLLFKKGHEVCIWNRSESRVHPIIEAGKSIDIDDEGEKYSAVFSSVTWGYPISLPGAQIIFAITPSVAHEEIGERLPGVVDPRVPIVLMPGRTYGSYALLKSASAKDNEYKPVCVEAQTLLHACRSSGNQVRVFGTKKRIQYASLQKVPEEIIKMISNLLPEMELCDSYFEIAINNVGAFFHPVPTILNSGWIESGLVFKHYTQGISRKIAAFIEKLDDERKEICNAMGIRHTSLTQWLKTEYEARGENLYECIQSVKAYQDITSPSSLDHRYVFDDLNTGLVPIYKTARSLGVRVPTIETFLKFACSFLDVDYIANGRDFPAEYFHR